MGREADTYIPEICRRNLKNGCQSKKYKRITMPIKNGGSEKIRAVVFMFFTVSIF